jgi:Domain of unknown function (DUF4440)
MRAAICLLTALLLVSAGPAHGQSSGSSDETSKLMALENAWNQAQIHHDSKSLEHLVGDEFIYTDTDGTVMNKAQFLADNDDPDYRATLMANDKVKVYSYSNTAIVAGTYHAKGTYKGKPFDHIGRFTDTWIYLNGMWQCVASHTTLLGK